MLATIIITLLLILIVTGIICYMVKEKKSGKSSCGGSCSHCAMSGACHRH
ncbi:MAG: FeoB-associated Cys-rich membrane protein [Lachnospiraceae bacterium]